MKLNKKHRSSLIHNLEGVNKDIETQKEILLKSKNEDLKEWREIDIFLLEKKKELIEQSLIENEIDF